MVTAVCRCVDCGLRVRRDVERETAYRCNPCRQIRLAALMESAYPLSGADPDVDDVLVELLVNGQTRGTRGTTVAERREAVRRLAARGCTIFETAQQLRMTTRTVERHRAEIAAIGRAQREAS